MIALVVDDDADERALLRAAVERLGFTSAEAENGADALAALKRCDPALIILDLAMPGVDGHEFLSRRRAENLAPHAQVLVLTGGDLSKIPAEYFAVAKPISTRDLARVLATVRALASYA